MSPLRTPAPFRRALIAGALLSCVVSAFGQGALTPPGAPAPTGRTLTQVEPRTDLATVASSVTAVISITVPGSYYATGHIVGTAGKNTIEVLATGVTIDLNGFALTNTDAASSAVHATSFFGTTVRNGRILAGAYGVRATARLVCTDLLIENATTLGILGGADSQVQRCRTALNGIQLSSRGLVEDCIATGPQGVTVGSASIVRGTRLSGGGISAGSDAQILSCNVSGAPIHGIEVGTRSVVRDCNVATSARSGIFTADHARVSGCTVNAAGNSGPLASDAGIALASDCLAENCTVDLCNTPGFSAGTSGHLQHCNATASTGSGFVCGMQVRMENCTASNNSNLGISALARGVITGCIANANSAGGIYANGSGALIEKCVAIGNTGGAGIRVDTGTIRECEVREHAGGPGFRASTGSNVIRNTSHFNGLAATPQDGFLIEGGRSRVEGNHAYNNTGFGFVVTNTSSTNSVLFIANSSGSNDLGEFSIGAGNAAGPILAPAGVATNTNPAANFNL